MEPRRKISVNVPVNLLEQAQQATGAGISQTIRIGLQLLAARRTYMRLRQLRGKGRFSLSAAQLRS